MRKKYFYIIIGLIVIPILLVSYLPIHRKIQTARVLRQFHKNMAMWNALRFTAVTNDNQRAIVAGDVLAKLNVPQTLVNEKEFSETVLKTTLMRFLTAFSKPESLNFREFLGTPDFDNYCKFRGFDLAYSLPCQWNTNVLKSYESRIANPSEIRKLISSAANIPGNGQNETPEDIYLLEWLAAIFDKPTNPNRNPQAIYCNGHWIGINLLHTTFEVSTDDPAMFLSRQPNCEVVRYESPFEIELPRDSDTSTPNLLLSTVVELDCGFDSHPVAVSLRWVPEAHRWLPTGFATGSKLGGINYIW